MAKPIIISEGNMHVAPAFWDVQSALDGFGNVVLFPQMAPVVGEKIPEDAIIYNLDPLYHGGALDNIGFFDVLRKHKVVDYQKKNIELMRSIGIEAWHLPYGYHEKLERVNQNVEQDIDVLYFGGVNNRRIKILKELEKSGLNHKIITYGCYGQELDEIVARAKVIVNFHYQDVHPLEVVRINYLLANKKFVVSERGWDEEDNATYEPGLVFTEYSKLIETCREYVNLPEERNRIAEKGQEIVRSMKMDLSILRELSSKKEAA